MSEPGKKRRQAQVGSTASLIDKVFAAYNERRDPTDENMRYALNEQGRIDRRRKREPIKGLLPFADLPLIETLEPQFCKFKDKDGAEIEIDVKRVRLAREYIDLLNPEKIDNKYFWAQAKKFYPHVAVTGAYIPASDAEQVNLSANWNSGALQHAEKIITAKYPNFKMLEIGPGYGYIPQALEKKIPGFMNHNYWAIDLHLSFFCDNLYLCEGNNIPAAIPQDLDLVYAFNVFQHLTPSQRQAYYQAAYDRLTPGGVMIVSQFLVNDDQDAHWWSVWDGEHYYCHFFNQLTQCDTLTEFATRTQAIGYKQAQLLHRQQNSYTFALIK